MRNLNQDLQEKINGKKNHNIENQQIFKNDSYQNQQNELLQNQSIEEIQKQTNYHNKDKKVVNKNRWIVEWTLEEDQTLFEKFREYGSKWVELTKFFSGKSDNSIKNRFYCLIRKVQRRMNKVQKEKLIKHKKLVSFDSLLTIMEIGKYQCNFQDKRLQKIMQNIEEIIEMRNMIIQIAKNPQNEVKDQQVENIIDKFCALKSSLKFINIHRVKKSAKKTNNGKNIISSDQETKEQIRMDDQNCKKSNAQKQCKEPNTYIQQLAKVNDSQNMLTLHSNQNEDLSLLQSCKDIIGFEFEQKPFDYFLFL